MTILMTPHQKMTLYVNAPLVNSIIYCPKMKNSENFISISIALIFEMTNNVKPSLEHHRLINLKMLESLDALLTKVFMNFLFQSWNNKNIKEKLCHER